MECGEHLSASLDLSVEMLLSLEEQMQLTEEMVMKIWIAEDGKNYCSIGVCLGLSLSICSQSGRTNQWQQVLFRAPNSPVSAPSAVDQHRSLKLKYTHPDSPIPNSEEPSIFRT